MDDNAFRITGITDTSTGAANWSYGYDLLDRITSAVSPTSRENVAMSREALRNVLVDGKLVLKPDVANTRFEGALAVSHGEFLKEN